MIRNNHNQYVSIPNWFTSETTDSIVIEQRIETEYPRYNVSTSLNGIQQNDLFLNIYNKSLLQQKTITDVDLTVPSQAISILTNTTGQLTEANDWAATEYVEIVSDSELTISTSYDSSAQYGIAFYDLKKSCIAVSPTVHGVQKIIVPSNARYFRACSKQSEQLFNATYRAPSAYNYELLSSIYDNNLDPFTKLVQPYLEAISTYTQPLTGLSIVVDNPLKIEIDSSGNLHLNINGLTKEISGNFVTTTGEKLNVLGIKTFENGIGIGDYLIVPDIQNEALKVIHKEDGKSGNLYTTGWLSALGAQTGETSSEGASALYQLIDVLPNNDFTGVSGAVEGSVLKYDGTKWYGANDEGLDLSKLEEYLNKNEYLTVGVANTLFLTPEEGDELFLTQDEGDSFYLLRTVFSKLFTAYDTDGNEIDITDVDANIDNISANYNFWSKGYLSALGRLDSSFENITALHQLVDVLSDGEMVSGAVEGSVLTYDGTHWYASKIESGLSSITSEVVINALGYIPANAEDIPSLEGYATEEWVTEKNYVNFTSLAVELAKYVTLDKDETIGGLKDFIKGIGINGLNITNSQDDVIFVDANLVVRGGITMYGEGMVDIPSIVDSIPTASTTTKGLASFNPSFFTVGEDGNVSIIESSIGLNEDELASYLESEGYATQEWVISQKYASSSALTSLTNKVNDFLEGEDTDEIINKWKELEAFLGGLAETDNLVTILGTKADKAIEISAGTGLTGGGTLEANRTLSLDTSGVTTGTYKSVSVDKYGRVTNGTNPTTLAGYGITDAYTKTNVDDLLKLYVTLADEQTITGAKDFTGGLKVNGSPIVYDSENKYWKLEGDLLVTGGVTTFASDSAFTPSTIMDAIATDGTNLKVVDGVLTFVGSIDGGTASSVHWDNVDGKPTFATVATSGKYSDLRGIPTLLSSFTDDVVAGRYLPMTGGEIDNKSTSISVPLVLNSNHLDETALQISNNNIVKSVFGWWTGEHKYGTYMYNVVSKKYLGIKDDGTPHYHGNMLWHTGNLTAASLGLGNVENTALSAWAGSTKITTLGTITSGTWNGTKIANAYLANSSVKISGTSVSLGGEITQAALRTALGLGSNAYTSTAYLPLAGGILSNTERNILSLNQTGSSDVVGPYIEFRRNNISNTYAAVGFNATIGAFLDWQENQSLNSLRIKDGKLKHAVNNIEREVLTVGGTIEFEGGTIISTTSVADILGINPAYGTYIGCNRYYIYSGNDSHPCPMLFKNGVTYDILHKGNANTIWGQTFDSNGVIDGTMHIKAGGDNYQQGIRIYQTTTYPYSMLWLGGYDIKDNSSSGTSADSWAIFNDFRGYFSISKNGYQVNDPISIGHNGNWIINGGNVGINQSSPTFTLDVNGSIRSGKQLWINAGDYVSNRATLILNSNANNSADIIFKNGSTATGNFGTMAISVRHESDHRFSIWRGSENGNISSELELLKLYANGNLLAIGGITQYSDIRKKTKLSDVELSLKQIADAPLIEHYYNSDDKKTTHVGSIAQYWAGLNDWFCKLDNEGYYTMEIQNAALASAISIARHLQRYENKTDRKIRMLKERVKELENKLEKYELNKGKKIWQ